MRIHFGDNKHAIALILDCIRYDFFRTAFAIHLGGIDQCHAQLDSEPQCGDLILVRSCILAHAPGTLTQYWNALAIGKRSEEHTSELQSRPHLVCRLLLEKKNDQLLAAGRSHMYARWPLHNQLSAHVAT